MSPMERMLEQMTGAREAEAPGTPRVTVDRAENGWLIQALHRDGIKAYVALEHADAVEHVSRLIAECTVGRADA